jgi:hypothetical protein
MRGARVLAEEADAIRQDHPVEAELQSVVIAADMQLPEGILGGVRHLQHHLVQLHVVATGGRLDGLGAEGVGGGPGLGINARALLVQMLSRHNDGRQAGAGLIGNLCRRGTGDANKQGRRGAQAHAGRLGGEHWPHS